MAILNLKDNEKFRLLLDGFENIGCTLEHCMFHNVC